MGGVAAWGWVPPFHAGQTCRREASTPCTEWTLLHTLCPRDERKWARTRVWQLFGGSRWQQGAAYAFSTIQRSVMYSCLTTATGPVAAGARERVGSAANRQRLQGSSPGQQHPGEGGGPVVGQQYRKCAATAVSGAILAMCAIDAQVKPFT